MTGSTVLITGAASGIGLHLTQAFLRRGYRVCATDVNDVALRECAARPGWSTERVFTAVLDVRDLSAFEQVVAQVVAKWGRLDIMLNNAGYLLPGYLLETEAAAIDRHLDINTKGVIHGTWAAARQMQRQGAGQIINIASLAGVAPVSGLSLYVASKFAVRGFSLAVAQELKPLGIDLSVVCPDAVQTPMFDLQRDYEAAALTYSTLKPLTVEAIEAALFDEVIPNKPMELLLPTSRGVMAKAANLFPEAVSRLEPLLRRRGRQHQAKRR